MSLLEIPKKKVEELFKFFNGFAPTCGKCGEEYSCVAIRFCDLVIGIYSCGCQGKNMKVYRGIDPAHWEEAKAILEEAEISELRTQEQAAMAAKIICPICGKPMKYIESAIIPDGSVQHRFDCKNSSCSDFEKTIWTKLSEANCKRIFAEAAKEAECRVCKEVRGAKIHCPKHKGVVCEKHCNECEFHESDARHFRCRFK